MNSYSVIFTVSPPRVAVELLVESLPHPAAERSSRAAIRADAIGFIVETRM